MVKNIFFVNRLISFVIYLPFYNLEQIVDENSLELIKYILTNFNQKLNPFLIQNGGKIKRVVQ